MDPHHHDHNAGGGGSHQHSLSHFFFDTAAMLLTFVSLGKYLESRVKGESSQGGRECVGVCGSEGGGREGRGGVSLYGCTYTHVYRE